MMFIATHHGVPQSTSESVADLQVYVEDQVGQPKRGELVWTNRNKLVVKANDSKRWTGWEIVRAFNIDQE